MFIKRTIDQPADRPTVTHCEGSRVSLTKQNESVSSYIYVYTVSQLEEESEGVGAQLCVWYCNTLCTERNKADLFAQFDHDLFWAVQL